jgi:hypothetical protein
LLGNGGWGERPDSLVVVLECKEIDMAKDKASSAKFEPKKTECAITRDQFEDGAKPFLLKMIGKNATSEEGVTLAVGVQRNKETGEVGFSTGSLGWYANDKVTLMIDGIPVKAQVAITVTVVNSKDAK